MNYFKNKNYKDTAGALAAAILAIACLIAAIYHIKILIDLDRNGIRVHASVVGFERGAKNSKSAIYHYVTESGLEVTARDKFLQYLKRVKKGDSLYVIYDRNDVYTVTADLGIWIWQAPAIFLFGFTFLTILVVLVWHHRAT